MKGNLPCVLQETQQEINMDIIEKGLVGIWRVIKDHPDDTDILTKSCDFLTRLLTLQSDRDSVSATCLEDAALLKTALSTSADTSDDECEEAWKTIVCRKLGILLAFTTINESGAIKTLHASARGALRKDQTVTKVLADVTSRLQKLMPNPIQLKCVGARVSSGAGRPVHDEHFFLRARHRRVQTRGDTLRDDADLHHQVG